MFQVLGDRDVGVPRDPVPLVQVAGRPVCGGRSQDDPAEVVPGPVCYQSAHTGHLLRPDECDGEEGRHSPGVQVHPTGEAIQVEGKTKIYFFYFLRRLPLSNK